MSSLAISHPSVKTTTRTVRIEGDFLAAGYGLLTIVVNGIGTDYTLERIGSDWGDAYHLAKHVASQDADCPVYHVCLDDRGHSCDCKSSIFGTARTGVPCKHVAALVALRNAGKI